MNDENDEPKQLQIELPLMDKADLADGMRAFQLHYHSQVLASEQMKIEAKIRVLKKFRDRNAFVAPKPKPVIMSVILALMPTTKKATVYRPPGHALTGALRFILPKKIFERVVEQMILDAREEHAEALAAGHLKLARWIAFRLYIMVGFALFTKAATLPFEKFTQFMQKD